MQTAESVNAPNILRIEGRDDKKAKRLDVYKASKAALIAKKVTDLNQCLPSSELTEIRSEIKNAVEGIPAAAFGTHHRTGQSGLAE